MPRPGYALSSFNPRSVPLVLPWWYRADQVHLVGSKADIIFDLSGHSRDQLQAVDANRWVWSATSGPHSTAGLIGTGTQFSSTAGNVDLSAATQLTSIFVVKPNNLDAAGTDLLGILSDATNTFESIEYEADGSAGQDFFQVIEANAAFTATSDTTSPNPAAQNSPVIVEFTADQTIPSAQTNIWINGVLGAQNRIVDQNVTGGFQSLRYWLGMNFNIPAQGWKGVIAENFAYIGLLTAQQRKNLYRAYLGPRYNITVP